jgi:hypothetical protein
MPRRRTFGVSFSWKRAIGLSAAKGKISRAIGIPLTRSGRQQKVGRMVLGLFGPAAAYTPPKIKSVRTSTTQSSSGAPIHAGEANGWGLYWILLIPALIGGCVQLFIQYLVLSAVGRHLLLVSSAVVRQLPLIASVAIAVLAVWFLSTGKPRAWYRGLPDWAQAIVLGLAAAAIPLIVIFIVMIIRHSLGVS